MDINDLRHMNNELDKSAAFGKLVGKLFKRSKVPFSQRASQAGKNLAATTGVIGAIGVGGTIHGSIKNKSPLNDRIMSRGQY